MPATAEVVCEIISVTRVRAGVLVPVELAVRFDGDTLQVASDWSDRKGTWLSARFYAVHELPTDWPGRGFTLAKADESHEVFVDDRGAAWDTCTCRGSERHGRCVHRDALRFLTEGGHL